MSRDRTQNFIHSVTPRFIFRFSVACLGVTLAVYAMRGPSVPLKAAPQEQHQPNSIRLSMPSFGNPPDVALPVPTNSNVRDTVDVPATDYAIEVRPKSQMGSGQIEIRPRGRGQSTQVVRTYSFASQNSETDSQRPASQRPESALPGFALPEFMQPEDLPNSQTPNSVSNINQPLTPDSSQGAAKPGSQAEAELVPWNDENVPLPQQNPGADLHPTYDAPADSFSGTPSQHQSGLPSQVDYGTFGEGNVSSHQGLLPQFNANANQPNAVGSVDAGERKYESLVPPVTLDTSHAGASVENLLESLGESIPQAAPLPFSPLQKIEPLPPRENVFTRQNQPVAPANQPQSQVEDVPALPVAPQPLQTEERVPTTESDPRSLSPQLQPPTQAPVAPNANSQTPGVGVPSSQQPLNQPVQGLPQMVSPPMPQTPVPGVPMPQFQVPQTTPGGTFQVPQSQQVQPVDPALTIPGDVGPGNLFLPPPQSISPNPLSPGGAATSEPTIDPHDPASPAASTVRPGHSIQFHQAPVVAPQFIEPHAFGHNVFPGTSGYRATVEGDAVPWLTPYQSRAAQSGFGFLEAPQLASMPAEFQPWWDAVIAAPSGQAQSTLPVDLSRLLQDAMLYSPQVTAIKTEPEVQRLVIQQEAARFDWTAFLETTYDDLNDPVGNDLTTGNGEDRLLTRKVLASGGVRRKNRYGGEFRLAQDYGHENQNSRFFVPNNQATARLELSYRQPLWDGAGTVYNESEIVLAQIRANSSEDEVVAALQDHLVKVTEAYWALYSARAEFHQRKKLLNSARAVLTKLEGRSQVDTIPRQVLRARAAVARAQTRIQRTLARAKDAEAQLRLLVNSPDMLNGGPAELLPIETPSMVTECASLQEVLQTALINRPDISEAIRKMRAAGVRLGVSEKEILPRLDFIVETYVSDLAGNSDLGQAIRGELFDNRPGYTVGLELEIPIDNRAALAKREQRRWELKRSMNVFRATVEKSLTDVEIANREVATSYSEMLSRFQSMSAAENESRYLQDRFEVLPAAEDSATLLLEDLLDSFERLADEETSFVQAQADHALALVVLKKEIGVLLKSRHARPEMNATDQVWVEERLGSAITKPDSINVAEKRSDAVGTFGHSQSGAQSGISEPDSSSAGSQSSRVEDVPKLPAGYDEASAAERPTQTQFPTQQRPMPRTPTSWRRPPVRGTSVGTL